MTSEPGMDELSAICPYLGLADDADSHATYATDAHRCYRLPTPTRIATNHQETYCLVANHTACPVFRGEGVGRTQTAAAAGAAGAAGAAAAGAARGQRPPASRTQPLAGGGTRRPASAGAPRPRPPRSPGALNPRPRAGGISMPVATVGLFAMAVVVILIAILIQQAVGGGGGNGGHISPSDVVATNAALNNKATRPAGITPAASGTPGTPGASTTPGTGTPSPSKTAGAGTPSAGGKTYTVQSGDTCSAIASANNVTVEQLLAVNPTIDSNCSNLQIGQVVKLP